MSSASPERWRRIEAVFEAALQATAVERPALLQRECGDDAGLRREVESLLAAHAESTGFLLDSAESVAEPFLKAAAAREPRDRNGLVVGRYRLLAEIGHGGMGTVWLAERDDGQYDQRVAVKLVRRGMDSEDILARFLRERQILARLEHPNIARMLDGGVTDDGRPYFVMEYVAGSAITSYCDDNRLTIDERLRLFTVVASAISYAHKNLVVHRDIKPSNVLVADDGTIKLLDFGIARLLSDESHEMTRTVGRLLTPEYASPEQVKGEPVTTASDVYQLGILLYELLAGRRPFVNASGTSGPVRRPSRTVEEPRTQRRLKGDLDTIVLRALRDEPDRRYPSAEAMSEDVSRHLEHRPILFGGDRGWYRAAKFVRRNRVAVTSAVAVTSVAIGLASFAVARIARERDRARYEADKSNEVAQLMARFLQGWSPDASDRREVSTKKLLADAALRADRELRGRPDMLGATLSLLGDFHTTVGEWFAADTLLVRAHTIQRSLQPGPSPDLAATIARHGRLYRLTSKLPQAREALQQALAMHRELFGQTHVETLRVQRELASVLRETEQYGEAEPMLRDILASIDTTAGAPSPFALETMSDLGYVVYQLGRFDEAVAILRPTLERLRLLFGDLHASTLETMRMLGSAERDRGNLHAAEDLYRNALRTSRALYGPEHPETEKVMFVLALGLHRKREFNAAEELLRQDVALIERLYGTNHARTIAPRLGIATIQLDRADLPSAERGLRAVLSDMRRMNNQAGADVMNRLAYLLVQRNADDADRVYRDAVSADDARSADQPDFVTDGLHFLAWAEHRKGDIAAAEKDYRRALAVYERQLPADHPYRLAALEGLRSVQRGDGVPH